MPSPITYAQALTELETILRALETDSIDVDDLTARVERSAELIRLCRHKLRNAEASLDRVFNTLDEDEPGNEADAEAANEENDDEDDETREDEDDHDQAGGAGRPSQPSWQF